MRACVQRVSSASVTVDGEVVGKIDAGLVVLLGVAGGDTQADAEFMADKLVNLRIFCDQNGKMNLSLLETEGEMLVVSQFTLLGDCRKGVDRHSWMQRHPRWPTHSTRLLSHAWKRSACRSRPGPSKL